MLCPSCGARAAAGARFCASCGTPFPAGGGGVSGSAHSSPADETRMTGSPPSSGTRVVSSGSGWLTGTAEIDHGRFAPGAIVAERYRIIGLLGRGGMGEVFRADDMRLGQPVALKFLPAALERDPMRLAQFHNEVRTARQVSHSNVCRVYDIGEADGQHFLTMEFVDGEDLSSLLRRIGRLPEDKALEIARQICAGLHAAHERGVLHRDLKPANIMLDKEGRARITDFSLAAAAGTVEDIRAGTPAYMAPEQLAGREVTARSDVYALGLVLYELFTGKRALEAKTIAELVTQHESGAIAPPSNLVTSLDPVIERAIMRCLQRDPADRPATAMAVAASLPGGDPLAAALAAGETPSPEMVAAAGSESAQVSPLAGTLWVAAAVALLVFSAAIGSRFSILTNAPVALSTDVLLDRARAVQRAAGVGLDARDAVWGYGVSAEALSWVGRQEGGYDRLRTGEPPAVLFWFRTSPRPLVAGNGLGYPGSGDPPLTVTGMSSLILGSDGRLREFHYVPAQVESLSTPRPSPVDWRVFFEAAGLDPARFTDAAPDWTPRNYADARAAWTGTFASMPDVPVRIDAASHQGWPVYFQISGPWARASRMQTAPVNRSAQVFATIVNVVLAPALFGGAALLARRNLRRGRGDRRGASRVAGFVMCIGLATWAFRAHHLSDPGIELNQFFQAMAGALFQAGLFWVFYLAVEPQVRRTWPHILITWSRLVAGSVRDPLVGRDLLVGTVAGLALTAVTLLHQYVPWLTGQPAFEPMVPAIDVLLGTHRLMSNLLQSLANAIQNGMLGVLGLALFRMLLRRTWAAFTGAVLIFGFMAARGQFESGNPMLDYVFGVSLCVVLLAVSLRYGLFATVVAFFAHFTSNNLAMTLDASAPYFAHGLVVMSLLGGIALFGFYLARAGEPLFGKVLVDD
jgi:serine/threonine-protein kinase